MKKKLLILLIASFILLPLLDFISYTADYCATFQRKQKIQAVKSHFIYKFRLNECNIKPILNKEVFRKPININSPLQPIYIFGCSFAYGHYLKNEETFGAQLAKLTEKPVYNFASPGWSIQHFLFLLQNLDFPQRPPEYIFYIYMTDHIRRMNAKWFSAIDSDVYLTYKNQKGKLTLYTPFSYMYIYRKITALNNTQKSNDIKRKKENFAKFSYYIDKIQQEIQNKWKSSKFIIIVYDDYHNYDWSSIEQKGIQVIKAYEYIDINDTKYIRKDLHPTAEAWNILTPLIIKEAGIQ